MAEQGKGLDSEGQSEAHDLRADRPASITSSDAGARSARSRRPEEPPQARAEVPVRPAADRHLRVYSRETEPARPPANIRGEGKSRNVLCWLRGHRWSAGGLSGTLEWCTRKHCYAWREAAGAPRGYVQAQRSGGEAVAGSVRRFYLGVALGLVIGLLCGAVLGALAGFAP